MPKRLSKNRTLPALFLTLSVGCSHGPKVTICVVDAANQQLQCAPASGSAFSVPIGQADNYVCMSPNDAEALFNYLKTRCEK